MKIDTLFEHKCWPCQKVNSIRTGRFRVCAPTFKKLHLLLDTLYSGFISRILKIKARDSRKKEAQTAPGLFTYFFFSSSHEVVLYVLLGSNGIFSFCFMVIGAYFV